MKGHPDVIDKCFQTEMKLWKKGEKTIWRSLKPYSLPRQVGRLVDFVSNIHHFPKEIKTKFFSPQDTPAVGPNDLRTRYNVTDWATPNVNNTQAVAEFQGQYYSQSDLNQFFGQFQPGKNSTVAKIIGPNNGNAPGIEAELDIQYIMGVNPNTATYFYSQVGDVVAVVVLLALMQL